MKITVLTPHFAPDVAPTGVVVTRLVQELAKKGHSIEVITSLPWYRTHDIEPGFAGKLVRHEATPWGRIIRLHPFPADKRSIPRRALAYGGFSTLSTIYGARGSGADVVLALSPPLTLGAAGWLVARARNAPLVFNIQDVFPDIAVELGAVRNKWLIALSHRLERFCYERAAAVTALSEDLAENIRKKVSDDRKVRVIPNFVDVDLIKPARKENSYRNEFGLQGKRVVMYAGNVGLSQSLDVVVDAAAALAQEEDLVFVINGAGASLSALKERARGLSNLVFVDPQPESRLPEVLAAADVHLVVLKPGLGRLSVPSKTYSIMAAGRPVIACIDRGTEIERIVAEAGAGASVPAGDTEVLVKALRSWLEAPQDWAAKGKAGRTWVRKHASPETVAAMYEGLFNEVSEPGTH